jgi:putative ABC transport system permease protein
MKSLRGFLVNCTYLLSLFREFQADLRAQKRRAILTTFGIVWGTAAVIIMMAVGTSVKRQNIVNMRGLGDAVVLLFPGSTTRPYQGFGVDRAIRLELADVALLRQRLPEVACISEEFARWDAVLRVGDKVRSPLVAGVNVEYGAIRNEIPEPGGRWFNDRDLAEKRRVVFLGGKVSDFLFGEGAEPVGEFVQLNGAPFRVVGVLRHKTQNSSYNYRDEDRAFIPSTTYTAMFGERYVNNIVLTTRYGWNRSQDVVAKVRETLAQKYVFDPQDKDAVNIWDTAEFFGELTAFLIGFNIFLVVMGVMTLGVGGLGVSNIMYVVVRERTREIGIRRSVGARRWVIMAQFLAETFFITTIGAAIGGLLAWGIVAAVANMPTDAKEALGTPTIDPLVALTSAAIITAVAFVAGFFPARRAANIDPIEALRS